MAFDFLKRRKQVDTAPFIRRIIDVTTPNRPMPDDQRFELRYNRTLPVLLHPWVNGKPVFGSTSIGFTRDLSDRGIGLIAISEPTAPQYVVSIWPHHEEIEEPYHFIATLCEARVHALGMWTTGFELDELLNATAPKWLIKLNDVAEKALLPLGPEPAAV